MKLSVIVPIYETERFLTRCLDSLVKQTFCDVEFILIDNGANEECKRIIDSYVHQYSRVKLITLKHNIGYSGAMNRGLAQASGDYIGFCDSDDWVDSDYFELLMKRALETKADIICTSYVVEDVGEKTNFTMEPHGLINVNHMFQAVHNGAVWNKIFRYQYLIENDINFAELTHSSFVDNTFIVPAILYAKRMELINGGLYHYIIHENSETHRRVDKAERRNRLREVAESVIKRALKAQTPYETKKEIILFMAKSFELLNIVKKKNTLKVLCDNINNDQEFVELLWDFRRQNRNQFSLCGRISRSVSKRMHVLFNIFR